MSRLLDSGRDTRFSLRAYEFVYLMFMADLGPEGFSSEIIVDMTVITASIFYGPIAEFALADMGIKTANDIGAIISNLVDLEILAKNNINGNDEFLYLSKKPLFSRIGPKPLNMEFLKIFEDT